MCLFLQAWVTDMYPPSRQDYVSIRFAQQGSGSYNNSKQWRRQSCWRVSKLHLWAAHKGVFPFSSGFTSLLCPTFSSYSFSCSYLPTYLWKKILRIWRMHGLLLCAVMYELSVVPMMKYSEFTINSESQISKYRWDFSSKFKLMFVCHSISEIHLGEMRLHIWAIPVFLWIKAVDIVSRTEKLQITVNYFLSILVKLCFVNLQRHSTVGFVDDPHSSVQMSGQVFNAVKIGL